ncbi:AIPR family protein [Mesorhizobium sp. M0847]|uniref:AIPR family protein n=1 Tax=unclassified Mesorhizobium TaxID=325217 RepID=UPI00333C0547
MDFRELGALLRCVIASQPNSGYRCILTMMPGNLLVEMYRLHGPRLLERNVRSFLQLKGRCIKSSGKRSIDEPQMFLAFDNGLSVTATGLRILDHGDGTADLLAADDFQIVEGADRAPHVLAGLCEGSGDVIEDRFHPSNVDPSREYVNPRWFLAPILEPSFP